MTHQVVNTHLGMNPKKEKNKMEKVKMTTCWVILIVSGSYHWIIMQSNDSMQVQVITKTKFGNPWRQVIWAFLQHPFQNAKIISGQIIENVEWSALCGAWKEVPTVA